MVVLAASILEKGRKNAVLFSRQFIPMPKVRIESLLQAFPKLLDASSQHTFIETDQVRYVYQNLDEVVVLLITNKNSDIMEDLDTLRLLCALVTEECGDCPSPELVTQSAFNIFFAFDEVITSGYKEPLTVQQVHSFLEMDSHEERLQKINQKSLMQEVERIMQARAEEIDRRKDQLREAGASGREGYDGGLGSGNDYRGFGSTDQEEVNPYAALFPEDAEYEAAAAAGAAGVHGDDGGDRQQQLQHHQPSQQQQQYAQSAAAATAASSVAAAAVTALRSEQVQRQQHEGAMLAQQQQSLAAKKPIKGMALGKSNKKAADSFISALRHEERLEPAAGGAQ